MLADIQAIDMRCKGVRNRTSSLITTVGPLILIVTLISFPWRCQPILAGQLGHERAQLAVVRGQHARDDRKEGAQAGHQRQVQRRHCVHARRVLPPVPHLRAYEGSDTLWNTTPCYQT